MNDGSQIRSILVLGAGTMGQEIGLQCALHGFSVTLYDSAPERLPQAQAQIRAWLDSFVAAARISADMRAATLARIAFSSDAHAAASQADLVSESVPEDLRLKRAVWRQFGQLCPAHTIFTTNTSALLPSAIAPASGRPAQFAALHFHPHVWESSIVDIMPHAGTAAETCAALRAFAWRIGQTPIELRRESVGYVFNAMLNGLNHAALTLAARQIASVEDIDRAWMRVMHMPIGPFGIFDRVGLDTVLDVTRVQARRLWFYPQLRANARYLQGYVAQGRLGVKSGQGFYTYPQPAFADPQFVEGAAR